MYRLWGGIPMTDKVVTVSEALAIGRSSEQQVYDFLTGDLKQIIDDNMLPQSYTGNEVGRVTLGAAKALWVKCISLSINGRKRGIFYLRL